jgi:hypothetical protein
MARGQRCSVPPWFDNRVFTSVNRDRGDEDEILGYGGEIAMAMPIGNNGYAKSMSERNLFRNLFSGIIYHSQGISAIS